MWLLFLSIFLQSFVIQAFPVFTFTGTSSDSSENASFSYLEADVDLPDTFILCSSVKQARFDDVGFLSVSGKDSLEWLRLDHRTYLQAEAQKPPDSGGWRAKNFSDEARACNYRDK